MLLKRVRIIHGSLLVTGLVAAGCASSMSHLKIREPNMAVPEAFEVAQPGEATVFSNTSPQVGTEKPGDAAKNDQTKADQTKTEKPSDQAKSGTEKSSEKAAGPVANGPVKATEQAKTSAPDKAAEAPKSEPAKNEAAKNESAKSEPAKPSTETTATLNWKDFFKDEALTGLIDVALTKNQELAIMQQEIYVAQNEIMSRQGEYLPKLSVKGGAGVDRVSKNTSQGASDDLTGLPENLQNYMLGIGATWEVDIWKKLRNATKAALFQYLATVDGKNFMVTRLVAEIAKSYYELMALLKKQEILKQNIELQKQALDIVRIQKLAARVTELAVKRFEAEVLKNQSRQFELKQQIIQKENELNFLVGRFPQHVELNSTDFNNLEVAGVKTGIPSQLLQNRPDVKKAELELQAAKLNVDVARARFYPAFSIEAGIGYQAFNTNHLFTSPESLFYNLAGNLTMPLLNRKGIKADYLSAGSKQLQAVFNFEKTIIQAFTEVTNQLNRVQNLKNTFELKGKQVEALTASIGISDTLFKAARCDYMEVLLTRRDALDAQMDLVEVKQQQLSAVVDLYQALGGGWNRQEATEKP